MSLGEKKSWSIWRHIGEWKHIEGICDEEMSCVSCLEFFQIRKSNFDQRTIYYKCCWTKFALPYARSCKIRLVDWILWTTMKFECWYIQFFVIPSSTTCKAEGKPEGKLLKLTIPWYIISSHQPFLGLSRGWLDKDRLGTVNQIPLFC